MKRKRKPGFGPSSHGSVTSPIVTTKDLGYGVEIPGPCGAVAAYYNTADIRRLARWLIKAAAWIDFQKSGKPKPR